MGLELTLEFKLSIKELNKLARRRILQMSLDLTLEFSFIKELYKLE